MYDITRTALTGAWRTGFGPIVYREDIPTSEHYPDEMRRAWSRHGLYRLLRFGRRIDEQEI